MVSEAAFLFSPVFYPVLEFYQNGAHHPGGPAGDSGAGGMGLCGLQISFPQAFVYPVYCFNADAISGDHAVLISGAGPAASYGYAGCRHTSCHFFHFPCVSDLQRVLQHSSRAAGGRKDRRRRRAWAFCKDRASAGLLGNPFRICAGLSGVLEYD